MVRPYAWLAGLMALVACGAEAPARTQLMLVADTDMAELDRIHFTVEAKGKTMQAADAPHGKDAPGPHYLGLLYTGGSVGPLTLTATGFAGDKPLVSRVARTSFVKGQTLVVPLHLMQRCKNVMCENSSDTCTERGCESADVPASALTEWTGSPPSYSGGGGANGDGGFDGGGSNNGGGRDGGGSNNGGGKDGGGSNSVVTDGGGQSDSGPGDGGSMGAPDGSTVLCDGVLTDLWSDAMHCGDCETVCSAPPGVDHQDNLCLSGKCTLRCLTNWGDCDRLASNGCELPLNADNNNCGMCNMKCVGNRSCMSGVCEKN